MLTQRRPEWLKKKIDFDETRVTGTLLAELKLNTVCQEARCPNICECFKDRHATFLILGRSCTRRCAFCSIEKAHPDPLDRDEPSRVAEAVARLGLKHAVITSVTRDDLPYGGADVFAQVVAEIKRLPRAVAIELLIPDFRGDRKAIDKIVESGPDIVGHNVETVPRLYRLRPEADYQTSLSVLRLISQAGKGIPAKSALMLGLGEEAGEVLAVLSDLRKAGCDFLALGQYLRPGLGNAAVAEFIPPEEFERYRMSALELGFRHVEAGPFVRSSYRADAYLQP